ncbi:uncharacterized protein Aud_003858, partial [Aspergillus udagawae]
GSWKVWRAGSTPSTARKATRVLSKRSPFRVWSRRAMERARQAWSSQFCAFSSGGDSGGGAGSTRGPRGSADPQGAGGASSGAPDAPDSCGICDASNAGQRGQLGGVKLVAQLDGLVWLGAAVGEADQPLPDLAVLAIGLRPPVPDPRLAKEGIDLDLVKFIDLAAPDGLVGLLDQPLDTGTEQGQQGLLGRIR